MAGLARGLLEQRRPVLPVGVSEPQRPRHPQPQPWLAPREVGAVGELFLPFALLPSCLCSARRAALGAAGPLLAPNGALARGGLAGREGRPDEGEAVVRGRAPEATPPCPARPAVGRLLSALV